MELQDLSQTRAIRRALLDRLHFWCASVHQGLAIRGWKLSKLDCNRYDPVNLSHSKPNFAPASFASFCAIEVLVAFLFMAANPTTHKMMLCAPGEACIASGLYQVVHGGHGTSEQLTFREGGRFPECTVCNLEVRYFLLVHAAPIFDENAA